MDVQCTLCPKICLIAPGESGECRIRVNLKGKLTAVTYGYPCSLHVDPVEKKPLFHFYPGAGILSLATVGCNLHCRGCQNWEISQANPEDSTAHHLPPESLPRLIRKANCKMVAYTYSEPLVYYEYTLDSARICKEAGFKNVLVSAGYVNSEPMRELCSYLDATNIDLKAMSEEFYQSHCSASLQPVLNTLVLIRSLGVHLEVTNLLIPTLNDSDADISRLSRWVKENLGRETPVHFSRFFPHYKMRNIPPTPVKTMKRAYEIAKSEGLHHPYIGNLLTPSGEDTLCPKCSKTLIRRQRYRVTEYGLLDGNCPQCKTEVYGKWL